VAGYNPGVAEVLSRTAGNPQFCGVRVTCAIYTINQKRGGIMGINYKKTTYFIILPLLMLLTGISMSAAKDVPIMTKAELKAQLDSPDVMILDVRKGKDWKSSEFKIKGANRADPKELDKWAETYPKDKTFVLYCA
jgi:hypothetical protein